MEMRAFLESAKESAISAGLMLKQNIDKALEIHYKGAVDLVTNLDEQAEHMLLKQLSSAYPDHDFLAEEGHQRERGSEFRWIIDPLDGTTNYAHRFPVFSVSVALEHEDELILGVVYDPMREELFWALKGENAYLNGNQICVSSVSELDKSLLATGFPYDIRESEENNIDNFVNFATRAQAVRRCGSAALDLCYVACGRFDGFWELKLKPWDVAAGLLMVQEAEGKTSNFKNEEFSIHQKDILATNGRIHDQMVEVLKMGARK